MTGERTMRIAQQLYEGIDIQGMGTTGLITYMRTDSVRISEEARTAGNQFIEEHFGKNYLPAKPRYYKTKLRLRTDTRPYVPPSFPLPPQWQSPPYLRAV